MNGVTELSLDAASRLIQADNVAITSLMFMSLFLGAILLATLFIGYKIFQNSRQEDIARAKQTTEALDRLADGLQELRIVIQAATFERRRREDD